jgi:deazaflavin-dependent oxidoreductase (nitroreductase family)
VSATLSSVFGRFIHLAARLSAPLGRLVAGRRFLTIWAMVEYRGRKSGRLYHTPLAVHRTAEGFVFPIPFGRDTQWPKNVIAAGGCTMRWNGRTFRVDEPKIVGPAIGLRAFNRLQRAVLRAIRTDRFVVVRRATT